MEDTLLRPNEVAKILGLHIQTVYRHILNGTLPAVKLGGKLRYRVPKSGLDAYLKPVDVLPPVRPMKKARVSARAKRVLARYGIAT